MMKRLELKLSMVTFLYACGSGSATSVASSTQMATPTIVGLIFSGSEFAMINDASSVYQSISLCPQ